MINLANTLSVRYISLQIIQRSGTHGFLAAISAIKQVERLVAAANCRTPVNFRNRYVLHANNVSNGRQSIGWWWWAVEVPKKIYAGYVWTAFCCGTFCMKFFCCSFKPSIRALVTDTGKVLDLWTEKWHDAERVCSSTLCVQWSLFTHPVQPVKLRRDHKVINFYQLETRGWRVSLSLPASCALYSVYLCLRPNLENL